MSIRRYVDAFRTLLESATPSDRESAEKWYPNARDACSDVARVGGWTVETAAGVVASLSPRCEWERNQQLAMDYAAGKPIKALGNSIRAADRCVLLGIGSLRGPKVRRFAAAIMGDTRVVVVDVHILRAAGVTDHDTPTKSQRLNISDAVYRVRGALSPRDAQALIWILRKRAAGGSQFKEGDF